MKLLLFLLLLADILVSNVEIWLFCSITNVTVTCICERPAKANSLFYCTHRKSMMKVEYSKPLKVSSCLSPTVHHKSTLMTSRNKSTPITLKTLKQQEDLASSQEVRLKLLIYFIDFILHPSVCQGFDFSECSQRGAGCCSPWICAWAQQQLSRCRGLKAPAACLHCVSAPCHKCFSISDTYQSAGVWRCHYSKLITTAACLS